MMLISRLICHLVALKSKSLPHAFWPMHPIPWEFKVIWVAVWAAQRHVAAGRLRGNSLLEQQASQLCLTLQVALSLKETVDLVWTLDPHGFCPRQLSIYIAFNYNHSNCLYWAVCRILFEKNLFFETMVSTVWGVKLCMLCYKWTAKVQGFAILLIIQREQQEGAFYLMLLIYSSQHFRKPVTNEIPKWKKKKKRKLKENNSVLWSVVNKT